MASSLFRRRAAPEPPTGRGGTRIRRPRADLDEPEAIARRSEMRLFLADIGIYRARFFGDRQALAETGELVRSCGYGRRLAEVEALERA